MVESTRYEVDPQGTFEKAFKKAYQETGDLTIPFTLITKMWYQGNKSIFKLKGPGRYEDLSPKYKQRKMNLIGQVYPINLLSGATEAAITDPTAPGAFSQIINKSILLLGLEKDVIPYAGVLQFGYNTTPARPVLLTGVEQVATEDQKKNVGIYTKILADYVRQKVDNA